MQILALFGLISTFTLQVDSGTEWKRYEIEGLSLSVELPSPPRKAEIKLKQEVKDFVRRITTFESTIPGLYILLSHTEFTKGVEVNVRSAAEGALANITKQEGVSGLESSFSNVKIGDSTAIRASATYLSKGKKLAYVGIFLADGTNLWQVSAGYAVGALPETNAANRVLNSIRIIE
jgi:hypothetical protein